MLQRVRVLSEFSFSSVKIPSVEMSLKSENTHHTYAGAPNKLFNRRRIATKGHTATADCGPYLREWDYST